jgi:hypothetical protein
MATPKPGDQIYVESIFYLHHAADNFHGGLCTVINTRTHMEAGREITAVEVEEDPNNWMRWEGYLEPNQEKWKQEYGERRARFQPDYSPELNDGWESESE